MTIELNSSDIKQDTTGKQLFFISDSTAKHRGRRPAENHYLSINSKNGMLSIGKTVLNSLGWANKFAHLYYDVDNKSIGWRIKSRAELKEIKRGEWRLIKPSTSGSWMVNVKHILNQFQHLEEKYKKLEIKKYVGKGMIDSEPYYFVRLKKMRDDEKEES